MSWLLLSFLGPILWAASTHLDKYLVERYFKTSNVGTLLILTACISALALPIIWSLSRTVVDIDAASAACLVTAGALYMAAMLFYLRALQIEDASLVAVFFQAGPLFGYALGYFILDEHLSHSQMAGGLLTICGVAVASLNTRSAGRKFNARLVVLMLACSLVASISSLLFKVVAIHEAFWPSTFWTYAGEALFGLFLLSFRSDRQQFLRLVKSSPGFVISINALNELINLIGSLAMRYALVLAPLSLVQAISSTTTLFVFAFAVILSVFHLTAAQERLDRRELIQKGCAAMLVAAGVALIGR
ncbi:DMT family transporter [Bradyrhizobium sp. dw_78]|uniref:DMT family transporter n=1 Tax=Bradyrhizobium sp. dw_78 TaxID=2719793 RepID=UPI001BD2BCA1|nr:DMT family transporter [Bradyrhizobium sp. dw_78]